MSKLRAGLIVILSMIVGWVACAATQSYGSRKVLEQMGVVAGYGSEAQLEMLIDMYDELSLYEDSELLGVRRKIWALTQLRNSWLSDLSKPPFNVPRELELQQEIAMWLAETQPMLWPPDEVDASSGINADEEDESVTRRRRVFLESDE